MAKKDHHSLGRAEWPPKFTITRAEDATLQFKPEFGSRELADAMSFHYPMQNTLLEKMQQASLDFLAEEACNGVDREAAGKIAHVVPFCSERDLASKKSQHLVHDLSTSSTQASFQIWDAETGNTVSEHKRKRPYDAVRRKLVAENRGNTCAKHKRSRTRVKSPLDLLLCLLCTDLGWNFSVIQIFASRTSSF